MAVNKAAGAVPGEHTWINKSASTEMYGMAELLKVQLHAAEGGSVGCSFVFGGSAVVI